MSRASSAPSPRRVHATALVATATALLVLLDLTAVATAAEPDEALPTLPDRSLVATPCTEDPDAACWADAPRAERFAARSDLQLAPISADVRLAHDAGDLLVRVGSLPEGTGVEVSVGRSRKDRLTELAGFATDLRPGVRRIPLDPKIEPGTARNLRLSLTVSRGGPARDLLAWAPAGDPDLAEGFPALFVAAPPPEHALSVTSDGGVLSISAPGAAITRLMHDPPRLRAGQRREAGPPLSFEGKATLEIPAPPDRGWYVAEAIWTDEHGMGTDQIRRRLFLPGTEPQHLEALGITPAPRIVERSDGRPFTLREGARICLGREELRPAAELLAEEIARFTGISPPIADCTPERGDLSLGRGTSVLDDLPDEASGPEAFALSVDGDGAAVEASGLRGAVYGALALADAIGPDGGSPAFDAADWPETPLRILYHNIDPVHRGDGLDVARFQIYLRRVAARGRFNLLILELRGNLRYASHPELSRKTALTREELGRILETARSLGMDVAPAADSPGHADWLTGAHPELEEDQSRTLMCTRHPETRPLIEEVYAELLEDFGTPRYFLIGGDEVLWRTEGEEESIQCARCSASPRPLLYAEHLSWQIAWLAEQGVTPLVWADMLVTDWNGKIEGLDAAVELVAPELWAQTLVVPWTSIGDPIGHLSERSLRLIYGQTGHFDARRSHLAEQADLVEGVAFLEWTPTPWQPYGWRDDRYGHNYHWTNIVLAGATAWRPSLSRVPIDPSLVATADAPAYLPGYQAPGGRPGHDRPLALDGPLAGERYPIAVLPEHAVVQQVGFDPAPPRVATTEREVVLPIGRQVAGVALLQATSASQDGMKRYVADFRSAPTWSGPVTATATVRYADGTTEEVDLQLGVHTAHVDEVPMLSNLWGTSGALRVPSPALATASPGAADRTYYRWDWLNPRRGDRVEEIRLRSRYPGIDLLVVAATALDAGSKR